MPTENRSSNTEMVSVPREQLQAWQARFSKAQMFQQSTEVQAVLAQPAEQHQGKPIMLTAVATLVDDGDGGLEPSWLLEGGTAELFAGMTLLVAENTPELCHEDGSAEVYTRADPNVRWKAVADEQISVIERLTRKCQNADLALKAQTQNFNTLRAQLAERDTLLAEIAKRHWSGVDFDLPADLMGRIKALSASSEPEAKS